MADTDELGAAYVQLLLISEDAPSLTLMNRDAEGPTVVIAAVVDRCAALHAKPREVGIGFELLRELGLLDGTRLKRGERPRIRVDRGSGAADRVSLNHLT